MAEIDLICKDSEDERICALFYDVQLLGWLRQSLK